MWHIRTKASVNLKQLHYFVHVARHGSLSRAATALRLGQPALSRHIRALEVDLRKSLFHRNGRGVVLTDAGARFLSYAQGMLSQMEGARAALEGSDDDLVGRVSVGMPPSVGRALTVPLVQAFQQRYPKARMSITEGLSAVLQEQLLSGRIDLAVMHNPVASGLLRVEPLVPEGVCLLSPPGASDLPVRRGTVALNELAGLPLISPAHPHPIRAQLEAEATRRGIALDVVLEVEALSSILALVAAGCGHALVPESVIWSGLPHEQISVRRLTRPPLRGMLGLACASRRPATLLASGTEALLRALLERSARASPAPRAGG